MRKLCALGIMAGLLAACSPKAVDEDATFTIKGKLVDQVGDPAPNTTVRIIKVDSVLDMLLSHNFLNELVEPDNDGLYAPQTNAAGEFSITLKGKDVNTEDGSGAAYLAAIYYASSDPNQYLATSTDFYHFTDANPTWDVGTLKLWDGIHTASESAGTLSFDWDAAPAGNIHDSASPYGVFAFNASSDHLQWAVQTLSTSATMPRSVFDNENSPPQYFATSVSIPAGGSQRYQHRTSLVTDVVGWTPNGGYVNATLSPKLYDSQKSQLTGSDVFNGSLADRTYLVGNASQFTKLYVDAGTVVSYPEFLVYDLGIPNDDSLLITVRSSSENVSLPPSSFPTLVGSVQGNSDFDDWTYLGFTTGGSARWFELSVSCVGCSGSEPYFSYVGEIKILN